MSGNGKCIVPFCESRKSNRKKRNISFHEVPAEINLRRKWIASIEHLIKDGIDGIHNSRAPVPSDTVIYRTTETGEESLILSERSVVCSLHFPDSAFKNNPRRRILIRGSVPSIFQKDVPISSDDDVEDEQEKFPQTEKIDDGKGEKATHLVILKENVNNQQKTDIPEDTASDDEHSVENDADSLCVNFSENSVCDIPPFTPCKTRKKATPIKFQSAQRSIRRLKAKIRKLQAESKYLKVENSSLKDKLIKFNINRLEDATEMENPKVIFLKDQLRALSKKKINWSDSSLKYTTELYCKFPSSYHFLREKLLNVPSPSTINRLKLIEDTKFFKVCSVALPASN